MKMHYTCKLNDGTVFGSSRQGEPIELRLGQYDINTFFVLEGELLSGLEAAVKEMGPGQSGTVVIPADQAHGPHRQELTREIPREEFANHFQPQVGQRMKVERSDGGPATVSVTAVSEAGVTIDVNHPLAGRDLTFELEVLELS